MTKKKQQTKPSKMLAFKVADDEEIKRFLEDPKSAEQKSPVSKFYSSLRYGDETVDINNRPY